MQFIIFIIDYFESFYKTETQIINTSGKKKNRLKKERMFQEMDHMAVFLFGK